MKKTSILYTILLVLVVACQKKPDFAPASDTLSVLEPPPMGATTLNDELKRQLILLDQLLLQKISAETIKPIKEALYVGNTKHVLSESHSDRAYLTKIFMALPELLYIQPNLTPNRKLWLKAKLYFINRRFVEAAMHMTEVLKNEPNFFEAKNLRARAIFFLGNPDLAQTELESIIAHSKKDSTESLDALYLIGAMSYEAHDDNQSRLKAGINAWTNYLKLANPEEQLLKEINDGLKELNNRLLGNESKINLANQKNPFIKNPKYSKEKNAIMQAFLDDALLLTLKLADDALKKSFDADIATIKGRVLFKTGRHDEALETFAVITKKFKTYAPGFHYQGMVFMMQGKPELAMESWRKVIALDRAYALEHNLDQRINVAEKMVGAKS